MREMIIRYRRILNMIAWIMLSVGLGDIDSSTLRSCLIVTIGRILVSENIFAIRKSYLIVQFTKYVVGECAKFITIPPPFSAVLEEI
jgi:hypothetical protein